MRLPAPLAPWNIRQLWSQSYIVGFLIHVTVKFVYVSLPPCAMRLHTWSSDTYTILKMFRFTSHHIQRVRVRRTLGEGGYWEVTPTQFTAITLWCASNTAHTVSHHLTCPGHGVWCNVMTTQFRSRTSRTVWRILVYALFPRAILPKEMFRSPISPMSSIIRMFF